MDKRQPYDFDTRIHLLARGPGIPAGVTWAQPATQVDMAPTFLGIAGLPKPATMDGHSLLPLLVPGGPSHPDLLPSTKHHLAALGGNSKSYAAGWRTSAFIEYYCKCNFHCCLSLRSFHFSVFSSGSTVEFSV
eukprot:SAG22_NODE_311_length_12629_cov_20.911891_3_plen_133_part_00